MTASKYHHRLWAGLAAGVGLAALAGAWAFDAVAPESVARFFTLYPGHGHGALYPPPGIFHATARQGLIIMGVATMIFAAALYWLVPSAPAQSASQSRGHRRVASVIAVLLALHLIWYVGQMAVGFTAYRRHYAQTFAGRTMGEKLRLCVGDYPDRWGALAARTPPDARILRHTRTDITFLPTFIYPRLIFIYEGLEFSPDPPERIREEWLRRHGVTHVMVSRPWEPGGPVVLTSLEEFLRERGAWFDSAQRVE